MFRTELCDRLTVGIAMVKISSCLHNRWAWLDVIGTMSRDGASMEEHPSADEDQAWLETMNARGTELWRRLLKDAGLGVIALLCLLSFMQWPKPWVIVTGVVVVVLTAWLSERKGRDSHLPAHNRTVVVTGCDTGNMI